MWFFKALESRGFRSSKLQSSSSDTDITAPQLSNSPQYYKLESVGAKKVELKRHTLGAENTVTKMRSLKNS